MDICLINFDVNISAKQYGGKFTKLLEKNCSTIEKNIF